MLKPLSTIDVGVTIGGTPKSGKRRSLPELLSKVARFSLVLCLGRTSAEMINALLEGTVPCASFELVLLHLGICLSRRPLIMRDPIDSRQCAGAMPTRVTVKIDYDNSLVSQSGCSLRPTNPATPITTPAAAISHETQSNQYFPVSATTARIARQTES